MGGALLLCLAGQAQEEAGPKTPPLRVYGAADKPVSAPPPGWTPDQTQVDFLDAIGGRLKVRWRQHYRPSPPVPSNERAQGAFVLGTLLADSFIALKATDAQQFRNTNQDVLNYCRTLGLGEKLTPRLMAQGKLAETERWADLRQEVVDGQQELARLLHDQRDDDLSILVDLGAWLRLLQVVSGVIAETEELDNFPLCIGSQPLLRDIHSRYSQLSANTREVPRIKDFGAILDVICRQWLDAGEPVKERVVKTRDKLTELLTKLTMK